MRTLTPEQGDKANWVNDVLDQMHDKLGMREPEVFRAAGIEGPLCDYFNAIYDCPQQVLEFCHQKLTEYARIKNEQLRH